MRVKIGDQTYNFGFQRRGRITSARVATVIARADGTMAHNEIAAATAVCSANDQFVRETGRKVALARVLFRLFPARKDDPMADRQHERFRRAFWDTYHRRSPRYAARAGLGDRAERKARRAG